MTPWGWIRFEIRDLHDSVIGSLSPSQAWATEFELEMDAIVRARISRRFRFWRSGSYSVDFGNGADDRTHLFALAGVVAIDKSIDRRRSSSAAT